MLKVVIEASAADPDRVAGGTTFVKGLVGGLLNLRDWPYGSLQLHAPRRLCNDLPWPHGAVECITTDSLRRARVEQALLGIKGRRGSVIHHTGGWGPLLAGKGSVLTVHDLFHRDDSRGSIGELARWRLIKRGVAAADYVVAVSESVAQQVRELGVSRRDVQTISHGTGLFSGAQSDLVPYLERNDCVLAVGAEMRHKRKDLAVAAFDLIAGQYDRAELVLVGPQADGTPAVDAAINRSPWKTRIRREWRVPDDALRNLLRSSKVMVFPTRREGFGLPVVEAMLVGTPVIVCTDATGIPPDLLRSTVMAEPTTSSMATALRSVLEGGAEVRRSVSEGLDASLSYTWERAAGRYFELYTNLARDTSGV